MRTIAWSFCIVFLLAPSFALAAKCPPIQYDSNVCQNEDVVIDPKTKCAKTIPGGVYAKCKCQTKTVDGKTVRYGGGIVTIKDVTGKTTKTVDKCSQEYTKMEAAEDVNPEDISLTDTIAATAVGNIDTTTDAGRDQLTRILQEGGVEGVTKELVEANPDAAQRLAAAVLLKDQEKADEAAKDLGLNAELGDVKALQPAFAQATVDTLPQDDIFRAAEQVRGFEPPEEDEEEQSTRRDFAFPTDPRHVLTASAENVSRVACEFQQSLGRDCDATKATAVAMQVICMETGLASCTGARPPAQTGQYAGYGQMGSNETRWALQEIYKWANSDSISPEARAYAQSLMERAQQIGADYRALNSDQVLGPALLMARMSNVRLSDADSGYPALARIQTLADDLGTQGKLAYLTQFMPAGWKGGQLENWNAPLSGSMMSAIGGYQRIFGAGTVGQAMAIMDGMGKYASPLQQGVGVYNGYLTAAGSEALTYTSTPPAAIFSGIKGGSDILSRTLGSPFSNNTPFYNSAGSSGRAASAGYTGGGVATPAAQPVQQPIQQPVSSQILQPVQTVPPVVVPQTVQPIATIVAQPKEVMKGDPVTVSWSSVGMSLTSPCQVFQTAGSSTSLIGIGNEGSKSVPTASLSAPSTLGFGLQCTSSSGTPLGRQATSVSIK